MSRRSVSWKFIFIAMSVVVFFLLTFALSQRHVLSAANNIKVGMQYLNERRYDEAIPCFIKAIELDPNNTQARIGLAKTYNGKAEENSADSVENRNLALEILEPMVYTSNPSQDAAAEMIDILRESGNLLQAFSTAQRMIRLTDQEEYYHNREELAEELWKIPRSFAAGMDQILCVEDGRVFSRGENATGQLGISSENVSFWDRFQDAMFPETAYKVSCAGRTSFVIDGNRTLWAAGENIWGQMGDGSGTVAVQGSWTPLFIENRVVDAAGTTGRLLVLLDDGTVWSSGAGAEQSFRQIAGFPDVISIASTKQFAAILTAEGELYLSQANTPREWDIIATNVISFTLSETSLCLIDRHGIPHILQWNNNQFSEDNMFSFPSGWFDPERYIQSGCTAIKVAKIENLMLLVSVEGTLWFLHGDGTADRVECPAVRDISPQGNGIVLELSNGGVLRWEKESDKPDNLF